MADAKEITVNIDGTPVQFVQQSGTPMNNDLNSDKAPPPNSSGQRYGPFVAAFSLFSALIILIFVFLPLDQTNDDFPLVAGCNHNTMFRQILQLYSAEVGTCVDAPSSTMARIEQKTTKGKLVYTNPSGAQQDLLFERANGEHFSFYGCHGTGAPEDCRMLPRFTLP